VPEQKYLCELFRIEKGNSIQNGCAANQKCGKSGQKRVALKSIEFDQAKTQEDKNTKTKKSIANERFLHNEFISRKFVISTLLLSYLSIIIARSTGRNKHHLMYLDGIETVL
jgi:hypothetical protein